MPYGGRLFGTDPIKSGAPEFGGNPLADKINDNVMGLLQGRNQAADQTDRTNLTALTQLQKNQNAGTQRTAAQMGIAPGDPRYAAYTAKNNADQYSMGSKLLGDAQQKRLDDQARGLSTAITFNQGQQNFGEDQRRYEQDYASNEKSKEVQTLFDIINNPLSSEGQIEAAKQRLLQTQNGLDAGTYNTAEKTNAQRQLEEIKNQLSVMNPGMSPQELDAMARERFAQIDKSAYDALLKANGETIDGGGAGEGGDEDRSIMERGRDLNAGAATGAAPYIGVGTGAAHGVAESYRGARDIARGDVIEGTGRIFAAPAKAVGNGVMTAGRTAKNAARRAVRGLFG